MSFDRNSDANNCDDGQLCGRSIICYLKEQGYSEIALFFEKDTKQRYNLALSSGNI